MEPGHKTKARLLQAGRHVFSRQGPQSATVREICSLASANVASINYHFGSKEGLFLAVLEEHLISINRLHPLDGGLPPDSPPELRLRAFVRAFFLRLLGEGDEVHERLGKLLMKEILEPTDRFRALLDRHLRPINILLQSIIRQMLPQLSNDEVVRCATSVLGQCTLFDFARDTLSRMSPAVALETGTMEGLTDFITNFSLGGIRRFCDTH